MCMCECVCMYAHWYVCVYVYMCMYVCRYVCILYRCVYTDVRKCVCVRARSCAWVCACASVSVNSDVMNYGCRSYRSTAWGSPTAAQGSVWSTCRSPFPIVPSTSSSSLAHTTRASSTSSGPHQGPPASIRVTHPIPHRRHPWAKHHRYLQHPETIDMFNRLKKVQRIVAKPLVAFIAHVRVTWHNI